MDVVIRITSKIERIDYNRSTAAVEVFALLDTDDGGVAKDSDYWCTETVVKDAYWGGC